MAGVLRPCQGVKITSFMACDTDDRNVLNIIITAQLMIEVIKIFRKKESDTKLTAYVLIQGQNTQNVINERLF